VNGPIVSAQCTIRDGVHSCRNPDRLRSAIVIAFDRIPQLTAYGASASPTVVFEDNRSSFSGNPARVKPGRTSA
jgi:hypothetical protein